MILRLSRLLRHMFAPLGDLGRILPLFGCAPYAPNWLLPYSVVAPSTVPCASSAMVVFRGIRKLAPSMFVPRRVALALVAPPFPARFFFEAIMFTAISPRPLGARGGCSRTCGVYPMLGRRSSNIVLQDSPIAR